MHAYQDVDSALSILDLGFERGAKRALGSDRDLRELELLGLLKVVDLDVCAFQSACRVCATPNPLHVSKQARLEGPLTPCIPVVRPVVEDHQASRLALGDKLAAIKGK